MFVELDVSFIVPSFGSLLRCRPLLRWLPRGGSPASAPTAALRLPVSPVSLALRFASRFRFFGGDAGSPKFLGNPRHTCPALRLRRNLPEQASGTSSLRFALSVLPSESWASSASATANISEPNHAACVLAAYASCRSLPSAHARLASGWRPCLDRAGFQPAGLLSWFLSCLAHMTHLQDEAVLGAPNDFLLDIQIGRSAVTMRRCLMTLVA